MIRRVCPLFALLLSVPFATSQLPRASAAPQQPEVHGGSAISDSSTTPPAARYSVLSMEQTWFDAQRNRNVPVKMYYPAAGSEQFPVIIFSTGLGRSREDYAYLGRHWAGCGYVSVHVQHKGSDDDARNLRPRKDLQRAFYSPDNIRNRPLDIIFVIDRLDRLKGAGSAPGDRLDLTRIGAAGHDFGAQTALALAGQVLPGKLAFSEPRVKAIVAMSAPVPIGQVPLSLAYGNVSLPCLHITGTADNSIVATTQASQRRLPFDYVAGADQYLVTFYGADHMTCSGHIRSANGTHDAMFQRLIAECSAAFWDAYLKNDAGAKAWLADQGLSTYLRTTARVEKKLAP